jgi:hypothetical protein
MSAEKEFRREMACLKKRKTMNLVRLPGLEFGCMWDIRQRGSHERLGSLRSVLIITEVNELTHAVNKVSSKNCSEGRKLGCSNVSKDEQREMIYTVLGAEKSGGKSDNSRCFGMA